MSTIVTSNVSDGTLSIPTTYVTNGSAKAWVNFNGTGTIAARDSLNVSSLTDIGTGDYTVNFSSAMDSVNFSPVVGSNGDNDNTCVGRSPSTYQITSSSSCPLNCFRVSDGVDRDNVLVSVAVNGDLA